jgi:anthranilate phosphoribosyltransferase
MVLTALENKPGAPRDVVALNAGAALYVCGKAPTFEDGVELAVDTLASGAARAKVDEFVRATQQFARA